MSDEKVPQEQKIADSLNIPFTPEASIVKTVPSEIAAVEGGKVISDIDLKKDYLTVRKNLREIIMSGSEAVDDLLTVAKESDSAYAYEVAAQLIKTMADVNKDLLEIHKKVKSIEGEGQTKNTSITNNSLFVGSTKELQEIMKQKRKELQSQVIEAEVIEIEEEINNDNQAE